MLEWFIMHIEVAHAIEIKVVEWNIENTRREVQRIWQQIWIWLFATCSLPTCGVAFSETIDGFFSGKFPRNFDRSVFSSLLTTKVAIRPLNATLICVWQHINTSIRRVFPFEWHVPHTFTVDGNQFFYNVQHNSSQYVNEAPRPKTVYCSKQDKMSNRFAFDSYVSVKLHMWYVIELIGQGHHKNSTHKKSDLCWHA